MRLIDLIEKVATPSFDDVIKKHGVSKEDLQKELENTDSKKESRKIALQHLIELPDYYSRLDKMKKEAGVNEDVLRLEGDLNDDIDVVATPIAPYEIKKLVRQGNGLRIIVSMDSDKKIVLAWAGDSESHIGAIHDTIASQFGIHSYVPLELTSGGTLKITVTSTEFFDDPREIEDALDRNKEFRSLFGSYKIDYSSLRDF